MLHCIMLFSGDCLSTHACIDTFVVCKLYCNGELDKHMCDKQMPLYLNTFSTGKASIVSAVCGGGNKPNGLMNLSAKHVERG